MHSDDDVTYVSLAAVSDTWTYTHVGDITVDGESFHLRTRDIDGSHHYDWVTGPNAGYGFSTSGNAEHLQHARHAEAIRGFLASVDPATGYL